MDRIYIGMVDCARGDPALTLAEAWLDPAERERFGRLRSPLGQRCFAEGRRLARQMLANLADCAPASLSCVIDEEGKPCFAELPDWHFNISHSGTLVACACARSPVGLDIEWHKPGRNRLEIADRFFTPAEVAAIRETSADNLVRFYHYWTLKEAWLKWHGIGLSGLSTVPEYQFAAGGQLLRMDGRPSDGKLAVWDLIQVDNGPDPDNRTPGKAANNWSIALAADRSWELEWHPRFGLPDGLSLNPISETV